MIQAQTLEEAQAIVNSSPHARGGMLADSGAGRRVASAYWALTFLRVGLCSRPHRASDGYGKAAHAYKSRPYPATHHPHRAFVRLTPAILPPTLAPCRVLTQGHHGIATAFSVSRNNFVRFSSMLIAPDFFKLILENTTNRVGFS